MEVVPWEDDVPGWPEPAVREAPARPRWWRPLALALAVGVVLAGAVAQAVEQRREVARTAELAGIPGTVPTIDGPVRATWQVGPWFSGYRAVGDVIVLSRVGGELRGFDAATGDERWVLDEPVLGCWPSTADDADTLLCRGRSAGTGSPDVMARLLLVDTATGEVVGEQVVGTPSYTPAAVGHDVVLVRAGADRLEVVRRDMVDGEVRWRASAPGDVRARGGSVAVHGDLVVLEGPVSMVLDADDGTVLGVWRSAATGTGTGVFEPADITVVRHGFAVRLPGRATPWYWYDRDGNPRTTLRGRPVEPAVTDGSDDDVLLTVTADLDTLVAADAASGRERWRTSYRAGHLLLARDGAVVVARADEVVAVDVRTGADRWRTRVAELSPRSGGITDGLTLVVAADLGRSTELVALDLDDGAVLWTSPAPSVPDRPAGLPAHEFPWVWLGNLGGRAVVLSDGGLTGLR